MASQRIPSIYTTSVDSTLALLLIWVFGSALITSWLGIFAIFGGFVAGVLLHQSHPLVQAWQQRVGDLLAVFFLPIFFTYTGLRTDVGSLTRGRTGYGVRC